jgi:tetratricopeptide (TPR) repeat protein
MVKAARYPHDPFQAVLAHYQAGRLGQAEALCRQVLQAEPGHADALHLLGAIARQARRPEAAADLFRRAISARPSEPVYHNSLGLVLKDMGRLEEAVASFRQALVLRPDYVEASYNLGNALQIQGKLGEAVASYRRALAIKPDYAEAHCNLGSALQAQGRLEEAIACYRTALSIRPNHAEAHCNLGNALQTQNRLDEAIASYRAALAINPNYAKAYSNLGKALQEQGRFDEAATCYRKALESAPNSAEMHCNLGGALRGLGNLDEAIAAYRQAITLNPNLAEAHNGLGSALREAGQPESAIASHQKAISIRPDFAEAYNGLGAALQIQGKLDDAVANLKQALLLKPDYAQAQVGLAAIYIDLGRFDIARSLLGKALELAPEDPGAWAALAGLRKMGQEDSEWLDTALKLLARGSPALETPERIKLLFAVGKFYDDTRQYELAFPAYQQANALKRQREGMFNRAEFSRQIDATISTFDADFMSRELAWASPSRLPVLIVGMPRSGTSLIEQIIASHPAAFGAGELDFWGTHVSENPAAVSLKNFEAADFADLAPAYERTLRQYSAEALRIVDKMPGNFLLLGWIHLFFPQAGIIHAQRNPIDTCLSIYFQGFSRMHSYKTSLEDLAFYYREYDRLMRHWRKVLPADRFLEVPYESLIENQAEWSRRIIEFIGLEWDERCLDFHKTERKVGTSSNWQVRQKIYHSSRARWRNYEKHLGPLLDLAGLEEVPL